jgi:outer membrane protein OmpA-like peptidoglycan-associated protein
VAFCEKCGNQLAGGTAFCTKCGAPAGLPAQANPTAPPPAVVQPPALSATPVTPAAATAPASSDAGGCGKALLIVGIVVLLCAALGIASVVYVGYRAKKKVDEIKQNVSREMSVPPQKPDGTLPSTPSAPPDSSTEKIAPKADGQKGAGLLDQIFSDSGPLPMYVDDVPDSFMVGNSLATSCPNSSGSVPSQGSPNSIDPAKIPLKPGMQIVYAWRRFNGDVEGIVTIDAVDKNQFTFHLSSTGFESYLAPEGTPMMTTRTQCRTDLDTAHLYITEHRKDYPTIFPNSTTFTMPTDLFRQAKSTGKIHWEYREFTEMSSRLVPYQWGGDLARVEAGDVPFSVILNDEAVQVPTIHLKGRFDFDGATKIGKTLPPNALNNQDTEVYAVDNPENPICLLYKQGDVFQIKIVKIKVPVEKPVPQLEEQLAKQKKAIIYGIYFDFDKDAIKPESEPVLKEIVKAMTDNPDWKLRVDGHTDNIGGDAHNLDLSKRRAASVKSALVERYHIAPDRLTTNGYGASSPIDRNDTLEGRARNRRVELSRE